MRALYVTNYQGGTVIAQRGQKARTLGASRKVEFLARGFASPADTVREPTCHLFPGFSCVEPECGSACVSYVAAIDISCLNLLVAPAMLRLFLASDEEYDVLLLYSLEWYFLQPVIEFASARDVPLVIEHEEDALSDVGVRSKAWHESRGRRAVAIAREMGNAVVAVSPELGRQMGHANTEVIPGVVGEDLLGIHRTCRGPDRARLVYAGGIQPDKGVDILVAAADLVQRPIEIDVAGAHIGLPALREQARKARTPLHVHGEVDRRTLVELLPGEAALCLYREESPECLAGVIVGGLDRLSGMNSAAATAREWVARGYSGDAAARKLKGVLQVAQGGRRSTVGLQGVRTAPPTVDERSPSSA